MRLTIWLKGTLSTPDGAAAPFGVVIEALVTDCTNRQTCPVGSTRTDTIGGFELRVDADVDPQLGRQPGESSALFVQARSDSDLVATANVCWIEDLPAGRAVYLPLVAARAIKVPEPASLTAASTLAPPPALDLAEPLNPPADPPPISTISPRTLPSLPVVEALRWV